MRDVLGTIQADQDAIIRAGSRGALVVDGGPGTGKTVVALHRTAYLLYADPRLGHRRGGVLFVGPHQPYLAYVADVLPSLGEEGVQTCTLRDLVAEGAGGRGRDRPGGGPAEGVRATGRGDRGGGRGSTRSRRRSGMTVDDRLGPTCWLSAGDWAEAFEAAEPGTPAQRGARPDLGGAAHDPGGQGRRRGRRADLLRQVAAAQNRDCSRPSTGRGRCSRRPTSSATCGRCRPTCASARPGSAPDEVPRAAARRRPGLDRVRPAAAGRRPAAARRPGGVRTPAPARPPRSPPSASRWTGSSTTSARRRRRVRAWA